MNRVRFCTYNLLDYGTDPGRAALVHEVVTGIRRDAEAAGDQLVLAVQEIIAPDPVDEGDPDKAWLAARRLAELAEATGLRHEHAPGKPALALGNHRFHTALLWADGLTPAGGFHAMSGANCWHSYLLLNLDVGAPAPVKHASFHATPFGRNRRVDEAERILASMTRPDDRPPGLVGGDWNSVSADRVRRVLRDEVYREGLVLYDEDPYRHQPGRPGKPWFNVAWHPDFVYQCEFATSDEGALSWHADLRPGDVLFHGGLRDTAAALDVSPEPTVGHWPVNDPYGYRRIDTIRVTPEIIPALNDHQVISTVTAKSASDHLPVLAVYSPETIIAGALSADGS